jgi:hypothetical protein
MQLGMPGQSISFLTVLPLIRINSKTIEIEGVVFDVKPIIFSQIKNAEGAALFICTAGGGGYPEPCKHEGG